MKIECLPRPIIRIEFEYEEIKSLYDAIDRLNMSNNQNERQRLLIANFLNQVSKNI